MPPVPAVPWGRFRMKILTGLKVEYMDELDEGSEEKVEAADAKALPKDTCPGQSIEDAGFEIDESDKNSDNSEILKMKLSDFKNTDKPIKVFSWLLGEEVYFSPSAWVTHKLKLKEHGLAVYAANELIKIVMDSDQEGLKEIHKVKKVFEGNLLKIEKGGGAYEGK